VNLFCIQLEERSQPKSNLQNSKPAEEDWGVEARKGNSAFMGNERREKETFKKST
jgi:hypothetical protein